MDVALASPSNVIRDSFTQIYSAQLSSSIQTALQIQQIQIYTGKKGERKKFMEKKEARTGLEKVSE